MLQTRKHDNMTLLSHLSLSDSFQRIKQPLILIVDRSTIKASFHFGRGEQDLSDIALGLAMFRQSPVDEILPNDLAYAK